MLETTFISNKTRKEIIKYLFITVFAMTAWILQIAIFSQILFFDTSPNLIYLGTVFSGIMFGPFFGGLYGILSSFFSASLLYDHTFYLSYPLIGFLAGILVKSNIADELLLFVLLTISLIFGFELINGIQYNMHHPIDISSRLWLITFSGAILNTILSPLFYLFMNFIIKKLNIR
ncbi:MAG: hypothetical protein HYZ79_09735 [Candidatus Melainabacteria bacterium]|nr:hypothetical protein [Candidatus Melainabacteria bacterium]